MRTLVPQDVTRLDNRLQEVRLYAGANDWQWIVDNLTIEELREATVLLNPETPAITATIVALANLRAHALLQVTGTDFHRRTPLKPTMGILTAIVRWHQFNNGDRNSTSLLSMRLAQLWEAHAGLVFADMVLDWWMGAAEDTWVPVDNINRIIVILGWAQFELRNGRPSETIGATEQMIDVLPTNNLQGRLIYSAIAHLMLAAAYSQLSPANTSKVEWHMLMLKVIDRRQRMVPHDLARAATVPIPFIEPL